MAGILCCIFNYAPLYREPIYTMMDEVFDVQFCFADEIARGRGDQGIRSFDTSSLRRPVRKIRNRIVFGRHPFWRGILGLPFHREFSRFLIAGEFNWAYLPFLFLCKLFRRPVYAWGHGMLSLGRSPRCKRLYINLLSGYFIYSEGRKRRMVELGFPAGKFYVIYNSLGGRIPSPAPSVAAEVESGQPDPEPPAGLSVPPAPVPEPPAGLSVPPAPVPESAAEPSVSALSTLAPESEQPVPIAEADSVQSANFAIPSALESAPAPKSHPVQPAPAPPASVPAAEPTPAPSVLETEPESVQSAPELGRLAPALQTSDPCRCLKSDIYTVHFGNSHPNLIFSGRLTAAKRVDMLMAVMDCLRRDGCPCNLTIIGDEPAKDLIVPAGDVWLYGSCYDEDQLGRLFYNADICISPGNVGLMAIHSMRYGTPVISQNNFETQMPESEAITEGKTGLLFEEGNVVAFAAAIRQWLASSPPREVVRADCYEVINGHWNTDYQICLLRSVLG